MPEGELYHSGVADDVLVWLGLNLVASAKTFVSSNADVVVGPIWDAVAAAVGPPVAVAAVGKEALIILWEGVNTRLHEQRCAISILKLEQKIQG